MFKAVSLVLLLALAGATAQDTSIVSVVEGNPDFAELYSRLALVSRNENVWRDGPHGGEWAGSYRCRRQLATHCTTIT